MIKNNTIELNVDGFELRGIIANKNLFAVSVEIVSPFSGIKLSTPTLPPFTAPHQLYADECGHLTAHGIESAESCLVTIYRGCRAFEFNAGELGAKY